MTLAPGIRGNRLLVQRHLTKKKVDTNLIFFALSKLNANETKFENKLKTYVNCERRLKNKYAEAICRALETVLKGATAKRTKNETRTRHKGRKINKPNV